MVVKVVMLLLLAAGIESAGLSEWQLSPFRLLALLLFEATGALATSPLVCHYHWHT